MISKMGEKRKGLTEVSPLMKYDGYPYINAAYRGASVRDDVYG